MDGNDPGKIVRRSLRRRLTGGAAWALAARIAYVVTTIWVTALVARLLPPNGVGTFFLVISVSTSLAVIAELGLRRVVVRFMASSLAIGQYGRARSAAVRALALGGSAAVALGVVVGSDAGNLAFRVIFGATDLSSVAFLVGLLVTFRAVGVLRAEVFRGLQDFRLASLFDVVDWQVLSALFLVVLAAAYPQAASLEVVLTLVVLAWLPGLALGAALLWRRLRHLSGDGLLRTREIVHSAWPLWLQDASLLLLNQADLWIVAALLGAADTALYGAALRFLGVISFPLLIVNAVLPPVIAELHARDRRDQLERALRAAATVTIVPALVMTAAFVAGGRIILLAVFGDFYVGAWPMLAILCIGQLVNVGVGSCALALVMSGNERAIMVISLGSGLVMVAAALVVAPRFGTVGVATAAAGGLALKHLLAWYVAHRRLGVWTHASLVEARVFLHWGRESIVARRKDRRTERGRGQR